MTQFSNLTTDQQQQVRNRFVVPTDTTNINVDVHLRPYEQMRGGKIYCTVRNTIDSFHNYSRRQS